MRKQGSEAGRARHDINCDTSPRGKRRKSSRAKHGATSQPKLQAKRRRNATPIAVTLPPPVADTLDLIPAAGPAVSAAAEIPAAVPISGPELDPEPAIAAEASAPREAGSSDDLYEACEAPTPAVAVPVAAAGSDPFRSAEPIRPPHAVQPRCQSSRARPSFVRWATAASIAAACLLALGRFSYMDVSAHAVPEPVHLVRHISLAEAVLGAALPPIQIAALASPPASTALLPPPDATTAPPLHDLAATIAPSASERVRARDAAPPRRIAKPRQPSSKAIVSETPDFPPSAAQSPADDDAQAKLVGRAHALGRYEMRWGTARLHEDPNSENAQGPTWDFLAGASAR